MHDRIARVPRNVSRNEEIREERYTGERKIFPSSDLPSSDSSRFDFPNGGEIYIGRTDTSNLTRYSQTRQRIKPRERGNEDTSRVSSKSLTYSNSDRSIPERLSVSPKSFPESERSRRDSQGMTNDLRVRGRKKIGKERSSRAYIGQP